MNIRIFVCWFYSSTAQEVLYSRLRFCTCAIGLDLAVAIYLFIVSVNYLYYRVFIENVLLTVSFLHSVRTHLAISQAICD